MRDARSLLSWFLLASLACQSHLAMGCTGLRIKPRDGSIVTGRTLEFPVDIRSQIVVMPRGLACTGTAPGEVAGLRWTSKYGTVGTNAVGRPLIVDGLNEKGLGVGMFYFSGCAEYASVDATSVGRAVAPWELPTYLLGTCGSVPEAVEAASRVVIGATALKEWGFTPPVHYVLHDDSGRCVVLEPIGGRLVATDNPLGVIANNPNFDWHLTNLQNYASLTVNDPPAFDLGGHRLSPVDAGTGMLGLPGNITSPSRFVRAVAFSQTTLPVADADAGVHQAFHLLNQFDIPKGISQVTGRAADVPAGEGVAAEYTLWTTVSDLTRRRFLFHTYENRQVQRVDLSAFDLDAKAVRFLPMTAPERFEILSTGDRPPVASSR